jgi:glycosyltransferase involved in cell wall biosynthesis
LFAAPDFAASDFVGPEYGKNFYLVIKLLLVIPTLDRSGAEKQFSLLATRLPKDQFEVHVVALTRGGPFENLIKDHGIPVTILNKRWKFDPNALWKLRKIIKDFQPDILHTWLFAANSYGRLIAGKEQLPKVIVSERCVDSWKSGWQLKLDKKQIPRTAKLIGNSQSVARFYQELGYPEEKTVVIPNGIEIPENSSDRAKILAEFDLPEGARVVGFVGRLAPQKRIMDLIWAFQILRQITTNVYFLIIGEGPEKQKALDLAKHMECDHLIRFAGHQENVSEIMQVMNVFWLASDFEGMSNSLMEAMSHGIPSVVSDIPPNRELIEDGKTGYVVKVGDSVGFAQFADRILADQELAKKLGNEAFQTMKEKFSIENMVNAHVKLYHEVAS